MLWLLAAILAFGLAGAATLLIGLRGRRINTHPICRRCGFDLIGQAPAASTAAVTRAPRRAQPAPAPSPAPRGRGQGRGLPRLPLLQSLLAQPVHESTSTSGSRASPSPASDSSSDSPASGATGQPTTPAQPVESSADHTTPHRGPRSADTTPAPTDTNTPVCSECGADLTRPRAIRIGQRCRRPAIATLGALVLLATLAASTAIGWSAATKFDWNTVKPDWLLARQLGSADAATAGRAAGELLERLDDGRLDPARAAPVAQRILQHQTDVPVWTGAGGLVFERMWKADLLREEHVRRYIAQSSPVSIHLRDRVVRGQPLPARFDIERRDGDEGMIVVEARVLDIWLDGERLHGGHFGFRASLGAPHPNGGHMSEPWVERLHLTTLLQSSVVWPEKPLIEAPPGRHTVRLRLLVARKEATDGWGMGVGGMTSTWAREAPPIPHGATLDEIAALAALPASMRAMHRNQPGSRQPTFGEPIETLEIVEIEHELEVVEGAGAVITLQQGGTAAIAAQQIMAGAALEPVLGAGPEAGPLRLRFTVENTFPLDLAYDIAMVLPGGDRRDIGWFARDLREASQRHPYHFTLGPLPGLGPGDTLRFIFTPSPAAAAHSAGIEEIAGEPFQFDLLYPEPPEVINGH